MKKIFLFAFLLLYTFTNVFGQTWLNPRPNTIFNSNQSIHFATTNLFINTFYLGGSNGFSGFFVWNGIRIDSPDDLAVAVSNSVSPTNFVFKVDFNTYTNSANNSYNYITNLVYTEVLQRITNDAILSNSIAIERSLRIASDAAFSNQFLFVPTNVIIQYQNSSTNYMAWTNNGKTWFFNVCLTNGVGAGGFGGTNIINITNTVVAGTTYVTNFFDITTTNFTIVTNLFQPTITNNFSVTTFQSNTFALGSIINNNTVTNLFAPSNNIVVGSTTVSNQFTITNNITVGSVILTNINQNVITNNIINTNIVNVGNTTVINTNSFFITNNINVTGTTVSNTVINTNTVTVNPNYNLTFSPSNQIFLTSTNFITNSFSPNNNINISNDVVVGSTTLILTNFFNTTVSNEINIAGVVTTNNISITNNNNFSIGTVQTIITNSFSPSNTIVNNNSVTNLFQPSNNFNPNVTVTNTFVSNVNSYPQNNISNSIVVGSTSVSNSFTITNNITVGSVVVTNNNSVTNSFSPVNNVSNIISFTNTFQITNNITLNTSNVINNTNTFAPVNNISNTFSLGNTYITNTFDITNNITVGAVTVSNTVINTNNFNPTLNTTFSPTVSNTVNNTITNNITNSFTANISNTNILQNTVTNYVTVTNVITIYATNIIEAINVTNANTFAPTNMIDISNSVVVGATTLILSNTFNTVVSNTVEGVVINTTNIINNIIQSYTNIIGGMTNVFTAIDSSSNYIAWVSNSIDGFISYNVFCVTNGSANLSTGNFANVFSDYVYNFAQNNQYSISGIVVSVMDSGVQTQATRTISYNDANNFSFEDHAGYGWQVKSFTQNFVRTSVLATNIQAGSLVTISNIEYRIWTVQNTSTDSVWGLDAVLFNTNDWLNVDKVNVANIRNNVLQLGVSGISTSRPTEFGYRYPLSLNDYAQSTRIRNHITTNGIIYLGTDISVGGYVPYSTDLGKTWKLVPPQWLIYGNQNGYNYFAPPNESYWVSTYGTIDGTTPSYSTNNFTNNVSLSLPLGVYKSISSSQDGKTVYFARDTRSGNNPPGALYKYTNFPIDTPVALTNLSGVTFNRQWYGIATYDGTNVLAATVFGDLWQSRDGGINWTSNNIGGTTYDLTTADGSRWWAARSTAGLLYSDNFGTNWTSYPLFQGQNVVNVHANGSYILVGINGAFPVWVSTNSGATFSPLPFRLDNGLLTQYNNLITVGASKRDSWVAATDSLGNIYKRENRNSWWSLWWSIAGYGWNFPSTLQFPKVFFDPYSDMVIFASGLNSLVANFSAYTGYQLGTPIVSTNRTTFAPMQITLENAGSVGFTSNRLALSFMPQSSFFHSTPLFWVDRTNFNYCYSEVLPLGYAVTVDPNTSNIFYYGGGIIYQGNLSNTNRWVPVSLNIEGNSTVGMNTYGIQVFSNRLYGATWAANSVPFSIPLGTNGYVEWAANRTAAGWSWVPTGGGAPANSISIDEAIPSNWWVARWGFAPVQSTNGGLSFVTNTALGAVNSFIISAYSNTVLVGINNSTLRCSTNNGVSWFTNRASANHYGAFVWRDNIAYIIEPTGIYSTTNVNVTNANWVLRYNTGNPHGIYRARTGELTNTIWWADIGTAFGGLWRTTNEFATVERVNAPMNYMANQSYTMMDILINPKNNNEMLWNQRNVPNSSTPYPLLLSTNGGANWSSVGFGFVNALDTVDGSVVWITAQQASQFWPGNNNRLSWNGAAQRSYLGYSLDFGKSWNLDFSLPQGLVYPIRDFAVGYGDSVIANIALSTVDAYLPNPFVSTNTPTTTVTTSSKLDSSTWKNIYDSVMNYSGSIIDVQISFNNEASYVIYTNGIWYTTVTNNAGTWQYWNGSSWVGAVNTNTPKNNALSLAATTGPYQMDASFLGQIGNAGWEYVNGFNTNTTTNIHVAVTLLTTNAFNPLPEVANLQFSVYDGLPAYTRSDSNYLIEQSTNNFQRLTRQATGTTDAIIHYMRNP